MPNDPKYVRLADHLTRGGRYDLVSGWGISGYDVVEMPDKEARPNAFNFVKGELNAGRLEGASKAEFDEAHPDIAAKLGYKAEEGPRQYQESEVQREAQAVHAKVKARRQGEAESDAYELDEKRRKETLKAQKADGKKARKAAASRAAAEDDEDVDDDNTEDETTEDEQTES